MGLGEHHHDCAKIFCLKNFGGATLDADSLKYIQTYALFLDRLSAANDYQTDGHLISFPSVFTPLWNPVSS